MPVSIAQMEPLSSPLQPKHPVQQQQGYAPVGASACWHCRKYNCRLTGKGSSKTSSNPPIHAFQRSQDPSDTEICLETNDIGHNPQKDQSINHRQEEPNYHLLSANISLSAKKAPQEIGSF